MSRKFRAAVLRQTGHELSVEELQTNPLEMGQVLIKMLYSGICRSQLMEQQGYRGEDKWLPHLLGHEGYGEVLEIGLGVTKCKPGDRVVLSWIAGVGINAKNALYRDSNGANVNSGKVTTFSTLTVISENRLFHAPVGFEDKFLTLFGCALLTGGGMAINYGLDHKIKKVCVLGFGGIGSAAAVVLKGMGKVSIEVIETSSDKRDLARLLGFENVFSSLEETEGQFDLVIEASGTIAAIEKGFEFLNNHGTLVFASHPITGSKITLDPHEFIKGKKIFGSWGGDINPDTDMKRIAEFVKLSGIKLDLLIGAIFPIDEINQGLSYLDSGKTGRPLLKLGAF